MSSDILGYIVVAWVGDTHLQTLGRQILHDDIEWARDAARGMQEQAGTADDNVRYEAHPVSAIRCNGGPTLRGRLVAAAKLPADVDDEVLVAEIEARFKEVPVTIPDLQRSPSTGSWEQAYWTKQRDFERETARTSAMLAAVREVPSNLSGAARNAYLLAQARVRAAAGSAEQPAELPVCTGFLDCPAVEHSPKCNAARAAREDAASKPPGGGR